MLKFSRLRFLRQILVGVLSFACVVTFAACDANTGAGTGASPTAGSGFKVATEPAFPPFESTLPSGGFVGFDIDVMNAIGEAAGLKVEFESLPFDGIIPALQAGTVAAGISSMTITPERAEVVSFSSPYFKSGLALVVKEGSPIASLDALKGKRIAVQIGTTGADEAKKVPNAKIITFDSGPLALQELVSGKVDAVINDAPASLYTIKSGNISGIQVVTEPLLTQEFYGIALPKNSPSVEKVNAGLKAIIGNGKYAQIYKKWFDSEPPKLPAKAS